MVCTDPKIFLTELLSFVLVLVHFVAPQNNYTCDVTSASILYVCLHMCAPADNTSSGSKENKADDETSSVTESERSVESSANKDQSGGGKRKKRVSWAVEKELRSYHYFELDETERGSNNCCKQAVMFSTPA